MEMRLPSLLSLLLWCLLSYRHAERDHIQDSALELEDGFAAEEVDVGAYSATPDVEIAKLFMMLTRECVIQDWPSDRSVFPALNATASRCDGYKFKTFKELLNKKWNQEIVLATSSQAYELSMGKDTEKLSDINDCLVSYGLLVYEEATARRLTLGSFDTGIDINTPEIFAEAKVDENRGRLIELVKACQDKSQTNLEKMKDHFLAELEQCQPTPSSCTSDECREKQEGMCPEGTACDCATRMTPKKAEKAGKVTLALYSGSKLIIGAVAGALGFIPGGIIVGAGVAYSFVPGDTPIALGMALAFSYEHGCVCKPQECQKVDNQCVMNILRDTSNPYAHLPPMGFKCTEVYVHGEKTCVMSMCQEEALGPQSDGVYNCKPELWQPNITEEAVKNSPKERNKLYKTWGIEPRNPEASH